MSPTSKRPAKQSARERLAQERRDAEAAAKRRRTIGISALAGAVLIAIVAIFAIIGMNKGAATAAPTPSGEGYVKVLQTIPASTLDAVGAGSATSVAKKIDGGQAVLKDGKPRILYIGAEFCPYCGVERWALTIALSRFGSFDGLKATLSSPNEGAASNIPTVSYLNAKYTSQYVTFDAYETSDRLGQPLQKLSDADSALLKQYSPDGGIPWLYWGTARQDGASFNGASWMAGANGDDIAAKLSDAKSSQSQAILGAANIHTAQICQLTGQKPAEVCSAVGVQAAAKVIG